MWCKDRFGPQLWSEYFYVCSTRGARQRAYRDPKSINWKHNFKILMYSVEDYARQWEKREKEDLDTLSEWVKSVRSLIQIRI